MKKESDIRSVLLYSDDGDCPQSNDVIYWLLHNPLIISETAINIEVKKSDEKNENGYYPNLSSNVLSKYDLFVVPQGELQHIKPEYVPSISSYVNAGGAILIVQPVSNFETPKELTNLWKEFGMTFKDWANNTPSYSVITEEPSTRILGLSEGSAVYPHRKYWGYPRFEVENSSVLTRLEYSGDPDLFMLKEAKVAFFATDVFHDLLRYSYHPEYSTYEENLFYLTVNVLRFLLGTDLVVDPLPKAQMKLCRLFHAYALEKQYLLSTLEMTQNVSASEIRKEMEMSYAILREAAKFVMSGESERCWSHYREAVGTLLHCMSKMVKIKSYIIRGWHGGISLDDYRLGGLVGYAEFAWTDYAVNWMKEQLEWCSITGGRRVSDIAPQTWEVLAKYYPEDIKLFRSAIERGILEQVGGNYSFAYLPVLGPESNIRQFKYGLEATEKILNTRIDTFLIAFDHHAFHPQVPQILNDFGYRYAVLRCGGPGQVPKVHAEKIYWQGLDGSTIESLPTYPEIAEQFFRFPSPKQMVEAEKLGYKTIVFGGATDATHSYFTEKEHTIINPIAPIAGKMVTCRDFFAETEKPTETRYFDVDDFYAKPDFWSGFGKVNEYHRLNRIAENTLLAAEKFETIATLIGTMPKEGTQEMEEAWKKLLSAHDHLLYGGAGVAADGLHTGSYYEPSIANYPGPRIPVSADEKTLQLFDESYMSSRAVLYDALSHIALKVKTTPKNDKGGQLTPIVVFNPLGWGRREAASIKLSFRQGEAYGIRLSDGKREVPHQIVSQERYLDNSLKEVEIVFIAETPSLGYKTYFLHQLRQLEPLKFSTSLKVAEKSLENEYYIVELDSSNGCIKRIFDKELGIEFLDISKHLGNEIAYTFPRESSSKNSEASIRIVEEGPIRSVAMIQGRCGETTYSCRIILYTNLKRLNFDLQMDYGEGAFFGLKRQMETYLRTLFPLGFKGRFYVNQPFGVYETKRKDQVCVDFSDVSDGNKGFCLIHEGTPCHYYDGDALSIILADAFPPVKGLQRYRYSIYTHNGDYERGNVFKVGQEFNNPLVAVATDVHEGSLPEEASFFSVDKDNIMLSALYREESDVYVRFYELNGVETKVKVKFPKRLYKPTKIKLNGHTVKPLRTVEQTFSVDIAPWQICTINLKIMGRRN